MNSGRVPNRTEHEHEHGIRLLLQQQSGIRWLKPSLERCTYQTAAFQLIVAPLCSALVVVPTSVRQGCMIPRYVRVFRLAILDRVQDAHSRWLMLCPLY